ncbi:hypothetical protein MMC22_009294 [Lobaria immixta]|nr:hypothetical protein [Lobaria immixta]
MALQTHSFIQSQTTHQARIDTIKDILHYGDAEVESLGEVILEAWSLLKTKEIWRHGYASEAQAVEACANPSLERLIAHFSLQHNEKHRYRRSIQQHWNLAIPAVDLDQVGENCLYQMEAMARKWGCVHSALTLVTHMAIERIQEAKRKQQRTQHHGGRGIAKQLTTKDWTFAKQLSSSNAATILDSRMFSQQELVDCLDLHVLSWVQLHLKVQQSASSDSTATTFSIQIDKQLALPDQLPATSPSQPALPDQLPPNQLPATSPFQPALPDQLLPNQLPATSPSQPALSDQLPPNQLPATSPSQPALSDQLLPDQPPSTSSPEDFNSSRLGIQEQSKELEEFHQQDFQARVESVYSSDQEEEAVDSTSNQSADGSTINPDSDDEVDTVVDDNLTSLEQEKINANKTPKPCSCRTISATQLQRINNKPTVANQFNEVPSLSILIQFSKGNGLSARLDRMCGRHFRCLATFMGLQVQGWSNVELKPRVLHYWACRKDLSSLKEKELPVWFSRNGRSTIDNDRLGFRARWAKQKDFLKSVTVHQAEVIVTELCGPHAWSITVDGHYEADIGKEMDDEFNLYLHHIQERNGQSNQGWSRVMYHSLTQQIVRQDLEYWSLCASLCTDGNPPMVSYPYYTKHAMMGESTEFRHINLNVPRFLVDGDGANAIQGSMSLDDETPTSCTEVLLGFHHHLDSWWTKVEARGQATNGEVHDLSTIWTKEDEEEYGPFSAVPCQRGGVRVTRPDIPHGSTATVLPDGACRRTVLPWFVGVQADNLTLDNPAGGTWRDLLHAHVE